MAENAFGNYEMDQKPQTWISYLRNNAWVGIGGAVEWITSRDMDIPPEDYSSRFDNAVAALVDELQRLAPASCEAAVEGTPIGDPHAALRPVPHGCWASVRYKQADYELGAFNLILVDDFDEWGGMLDGRDEGYTRLRIDTRFVLLRWHPATLEIDPDRQIASRNDRQITASARISEPAVRRYIEKVMSLLPVTDSPFTIKELKAFAESRFPAVQRTVIRKIHAELFPNKKRGRHGAPNSARQERIEELCRKENAAQLHK